MIVKYKKKRPKISLKQFFCKCIELFSSYSYIKKLRNLIGKNCLAESCEYLFVWIRSTVVVNVKLNGFFFFKWKKYMYKQNCQLEVKEWVTDKVTEWCCLNTGLKGLKVWRH